MLSEAMQTDRAMLADSGYERVENDFYATPPEFVDCLAHFVNLTTRRVWECACGEGHISKRLIELGLGGKIYSSDLVDRGYGVAGFDFLTQKRGVHPYDAIVTNPPYGDEAELFIRHALMLMKPANGLVAMFLRNEYDCGKERMPLFAEYPFSKKIICTKRPRWIAGSKGSPRHNYSWYVWDFLQDSDPTVHYIHPTFAKPLTACAQHR